MIHDCRGRVIVWSQGTEELLGYAFKEMAGKSFSNVLAEEARLEDEAIITRTLSGEPGAYRSHLVTKDGRTVEMDIFVLPWRDDSGKVIALFRFIGGIIERVKDRVKVRISGEEQQLILDGIQELIAYQDRDNRVLWANLATGRSVDQTPDELVGRFCYEIWHQRDSPCEGCPVVIARETGKPQEAEITSPDGRIWHIRGYPIVDEKEVFGIIEITSEITERKLMEKQARQAREIAEGIVETIREPLLVLDADLKVVSANGPSTALSGRLLRRQRAA